MPPPRRYQPQPPSGYEMMQRMEQRQIADRRRVLRGLNWASLLVLFGSIALTALTPFRLVPFIIMLPAIGLMVVLAIVTLAKGGVGQGLATLLFGAVIMPIWWLIGPDMIEGVKKSGSLEAYQVDLMIEQEEADARRKAREQTR